MKTSDFVAMLKKETDQTSNFRTFEGKWCSGAHRVPDAISNKIGLVVSLLQARVNEGQLCNKNEYLLIYNFQPLLITDDSYLCSLDMIIKPISEISQNSINQGIPLQLVINGTTGEVMNNAMGMLEMGIATLKELEEEGDPAVSYGNYNNLNRNEGFPLSNKFRELQNSFKQAIMPISQEILLESALPATNFRKETNFLSFSNDKKRGFIDAIVSPEASLKLRISQQPEELLFSQGNKLPSPWNQMVANSINKIDSTNLARAASAPGKL